ncbi:MAG: hypothetical protein DRO04_00470 [Candidatus Iainarchaeum archaeon]|uniref:Class III signal peptide-containing protein n=1 Tax=Candidatus Iainarchaeum sp. TaxID=3101447 RepID=A0A497JHY6_9ARCH|nr:MAG: hypothetical protein DRO04_00470 [Candidatus Diapherotrites archaeon]
MKVLKCRKAQGSLEVLLMLLAGIIIAAAVGLYLKSLSKEEIAEKLNQTANQTAQNLEEI